ncbi:MAG: amidohydrolase [Vicinamibacteria bacterium]|nr:amidohydrolase [Vicinamibacteria bacterium]
MHHARRSAPSALLILAAALLPAASSALAQKPRIPSPGPKAAVIAAIEAQRGRWATCARDVWTYAEVGYQEEKSSQRLQRELTAAGFEVRANVADMPTAFVASYGSGQPVIAILAEFDALPGLSQDAAPEKKALKEGGAGHGCGHHLFGAASVAAAVAVKDWLAASKTPGTLRVYGTPAEEGGGGKVYMIRAGLFSDVDAVLSWHPAATNDASPETTLANLSAKFRFHGKASHAAIAPEQGRSALDGLQAMTYMVDMMREHVPQETRIHFIITRGGSAPNVVPDFAELYFYVRHPQNTVLREVFDRVVKASEGAALGTGTRVEHEIMNGVYGKLPNHTLGRIVDANLREVGGYTMTADERAFAETLRTSLAKPLPLESTLAVARYKEGLAAPASTDVGDVSWNVATAELTTATWVPGTPAHSWQAVAAGGTSIGTQGMMVAAKTLAASALDLFLQPAVIEKAKAELKQAQGPGFVYQALIGERKPPLDYRK